ncbi:TPA: hypothetical protein N0F65_003230 [Lagenidium giganteum]|uniref:Integrase catalytic domain-containing protein n=1 Tax=Lagenidium giganteum TaxID=4803 RepID=A0AAV2ZCF8_9STRA|nr:TPA: hypothetical protein N0F65_003230 [Lagenidium giganteum]
MYGLTVIDHTTCWLEVFIQPDKQSVTTVESFEEAWLIYMLASYGIKPKPITSKNPQASEIRERVHLELMNVVRCHQVDWTNVTHYAAFAVRASYHRILDVSPGQLVFGQDLITRQLYQSNGSYLSKRRFESILAEKRQRGST